MRPRRLPYTSTTLLLGCTFPTLNLKATLLLITDLSFPGVGVFDHLNGP